MRLEFSLIYKSILHHVDHNKKRRFFNQSRHENDVLFCFFFLRNILKSHMKATKPTNRFDILTSTQYIIALLFPSSLLLAR